jgi:DNA-binding response OmpR family regulator
MNILIIEDDARVGSFLERGLKAEGYRVQWAKTGGEGIALARSMMDQITVASDKAVILLDVMLPDQNGFTVCQTLRSGGVHIPILMLTALNSLEDRVNGLRLGADDYLPKPFAFEEVLARIEVLARRSIQPRLESKSVLVVDDLQMDLEKMRVERAGNPIELTAKELALLELLMSAPGRLFSRERILANVWGVNEDPLTNVVDVYIRRLRNKIDLEGFTPLIHTQRGLGYRLEAVSSKS